MSQLSINALKNPFDYGFHVLSSTTHKTLRGPRGGLILSKGTASNPLKTPQKTIENLPTLIDRSVFPGIQGGPMMHTIAAKAVALYEASQPQFATYARVTIENAQTLASELMARGCHLVTNGTDNHLILLDCVKSFGIDGAEAEARLDSIGLTLNKNSIPDDSNPPFRPSGIRFGTPAITTRGAKPQDMTQLAEWIVSALKGSSQVEMEKLHSQVKAYATSLVSPSEL